jgi:hydrogenase maturation protease
VINQTPKKDIVVIGLGNLLLSDEGIGVRLAERLSQRQSEFPLVDFVEAGSAGMSLLHIIANRKKAVIIDCAKMGVPPGTIRRFTPDDVQSVKKLSQYSLHEADILQVVKLSQQLGECPREIVFFGIEPESLEPGRELSETLSAKTALFLEKINKELR